MIIIEGNMFMILVLYVYMLGCDIDKLIEKRSMAPYQIGCVNQSVNKCRLDT